LAQLTSLPERRWTEEFLTNVREEGKKDEAYEQARKQEAAMEAGLAIVRPARPGLAVF